MSTSSPRAPEVLSEPRLYFPVGSMGSGDYERLCGSGQSLAQFCLDADTERARYLAHKRSIVQRVGRGVLRIQQDAAGRAITEAERFIRARALELPAFAGEAERLARLSLDELVMGLQEDLAIMQCAADHAPERARAVYLHVCFPSGWSPSRLIGKSFPALHARVPYEPGFERRERPQHAARLFGEPAARFVWSVTSSDALDRHPESAPGPSWQQAEQAFLRVERQIIVPLAAESLADSQTALFFIRTYVYPLSRLSAEQRRALRSALEAMPESVRSYKGLLGHEPRLHALI